MYDECQSYRKDSDKTLFIRQLLSTSITFAFVYIMLDVLDECETDILDDLIVLIRQLKNSGIKVFYSISLISKNDWM